MRFTGQVTIPVVVAGFPGCGRRACVSVWNNGTSDSNGDDAGGSDDGGFRRRHLQLCLKPRVSRSEFEFHVTLLPLADVTVSAQ